MSKKATKSSAAKPVKIAEPVEQPPTLAVIPPIHADEVDGVERVLIDAVIPVAADLKTIEKIYEKRYGPPPTVGRVVLYRQGVLDHLTGKMHDASWQGTNGTRWHPATITRVWPGSDVVNLMVMFDGYAPCAVTSVLHLLVPQESIDTNPTIAGWRWPDRV
jgi:hypothetical protein